MFFEDLDWLKSSSTCEVKINTLTPRIDFYGRYKKLDSYVSVVLDIGVAEHVAQHLLYIFLIKMLGVEHPGAKGRCHKESSGFEGPWTTNPLVFDNSSFKELLNGEKEGLIQLRTDKTLLADPFLRPLLKNMQRTLHLYCVDSIKKHTRRAAMKTANEFLLRDRVEGRRRSRLFISVQLHGFSRGEDLLLLVLLDAKFTSNLGSGTRISHNCAL
ncbi:hypothetical protein C5167_025044 [Papaver somniferum]|uniref:Uncharacterized protein n=1 Tax=Papaver somniferum TaxID=3469 RepID=A0A4Y7JTL5_PAPSO|nr:hypothetical protein C5167_025044 [Papaver somniferum]